VSTLSNPPPLIVTQHHRSAAELMSSSPQTARRTLDQRLTSGQDKKAGGKLSAGLSASVDARSGLQIAAGNRSWGLKAPSAAPAAASAAASAADAGSEYGSCASLDSMDRQLTTKTVIAHDADISSAVESDATAASELRRRRRAELVRARTAGERSSVGGGSALEKPGDLGNEPRTAADRLSHPAASTSTTAGVAARRPGISTPSSSSTPSLHTPVSPTSCVHGEHPVVTQPTTQQSFQQTHSKTPWRSIRSATDTIPSRLSDQKSLHAITSDHPQQISPATCLPTTSTQSSSSSITSSRSPSTTSMESVKNDFKRPETRLKSSLYGSASSSHPSKKELEAAGGGGGATTSCSAAAGRAPRLTIYSADMRHHDTQGSTGSEAAHTKDWFNELVGKALESTSSAGGHYHHSQHEHSTEPQLHHESSESVDQFVNETAEQSSLKKVEIELEPSAPAILESLTTAETQSRQFLSRGFNEVQTAVSNITTNTTQSTAHESVQPIKATVDKVPHRTTTGGHHHPSKKQYISDLSAFVSVTTQSAPVTSTGGIFSHRSQTGTSQQQDTPQTLDHSKVKSFPSSSFEPSRKLQPVRSGDVSGVAETCLQERQNALNVESEAVSSKVPESLVSGLENTSQSQQLDTTISTEGNADTASSEKTPSQLYNTTKFTHQTADGNQCKGLENVEISSKAAGAHGELEVSMPSELTADVKKEVLHDTKKEQHPTENGLESTRSSDNRSRQPNVVEESQIVRVLTFGGGDPKSSTLPAAAASLVDASDKTKLVHKTDLVTPQLCQLETKSSNVHVSENISKLSSDDRLKLLQTLASASCLDASEVRIQPASKPCVADVGTKTQTTLNDHLNCSDVPHSVLSSCAVSQESSRLLGDSLSVDSKPLAAEPCQIRQADLETVPPSMEEKVETIYQAERQTAVLQEIGMTAEQSLFHNREIEIERVIPVSVESTVNTEDSQRLLARTGCQYHATVVALSASETTDQKVEKIGRMEGFPQLERLKPNNVENTFRSADARPYLRKTSCHYRTNLLTFHPTEKDRIVQADHFQNPYPKPNPSLNPNHNLRDIEGFESESSTSSTVEDDAVHGTREKVKIAPVPRVLTTQSEHRKLVPRRGKPYDEFSTPALEQKTKQQVPSSASGRDVLRSDVRENATFPVPRQEVEVTTNPNQKIETSESAQAITGSQSITSSDSLPSSFQIRRPSSQSGGTAKSDGASIGQPSTSSVQKGSNTATDSPMQVPEHAETSAGQRVNMWRTSRPQSQDKASTSQPRSISDKKQPLKPEKSSEHVGFATAKILQAINTSSVVTSTESCSQSSVPTDFSATTQEDKTVSLSNNPFRPTAASSTSLHAGTEQPTENFPAHATDGGEAAVAIKRDSTVKARNILRSREDFLALQSHASTSTDVVETTQGELAQLDLSPTIRKTTNTGKKDMIELPSDPRHSKTVKIAIREDDVVDEQEDTEGQNVVPADTAKAAFPKLVSGRCWDAIVRSSSSSEEQTSSVKVDRRPVEPRRPAVESRSAFAASRAQTTAGVPDTGKSSRPILQQAKSVDSEPSPSGTVNIDPQLAAVLRMRKQREEELEREEAVLKAEETENSQYAKTRYRYAEVEILLL